jgi:methionyl-tRNA formyltransferase
MRSALVGAVESTALALRALVRAGHPPEVLVTLPLEKSARHSDFVDLRPLARETGVELVETARVNAPEVVALLARSRLDHLFVIGWSQIVSQELLALASRGAIGFHPAPLPELRGRAVIPWTILLERRTTGSSLFWMDEGMDTGDLLSQVLFDVADDETAATLIAKHSSALDGMLSRVVPQLASGTATRTPQDEARASYCAKRTAADGLIDWTRSAREVWTLIRAIGDPYPGAFTFSGERPLVVWAADLVEEAPYFGLPGQIQQLHPDGSALVACGSGFVRLRLAQLEAAGRVSPAGVLQIHERLGPGRQQRRSSS